MFYGGRLLSNLSADREDVPEELINLLHINQRCVVMIDSDRRNPGDRLGGTKERIESECAASGSLCWITDGREIENYLSASVISDACKELFGVPFDAEPKPFESVGMQIEALVQEKFSKAIRFSQHKIAFARVATRALAEGDITGPLREMLDLLTARIREWNG